MKSLILLSCSLLFACTSPFSHTSRSDTAQLAVEVGALDKALEIEKENAMRNPKDANARMKLADIYFRLKRYDMEKNELNALTGLTSGTSEMGKKAKLDLIRNSLLRHDYEETENIYKSLMEENVDLSPEANGKALMYSGIAKCKQNDFDVCIARLDDAIKYLPGDESLAANLKLANWMNLAKKSRDTGNSSELAQAYNDNKSTQMFANLVLSLAHEGDYSHAFELLSSQYSVEDAQTIINDLKSIEF